MQYKFIISRYNEDLSWIKIHDYIVNNSIIYNKGEKLIDFNNVINISNNPEHGREADTYLKFIIDNYYQLPEYTFFIQGYPFDHSPEFIPITSYMIINNIFKDYQPLSCFWKREYDIPPINNVLYSKFYDLNNYKIYMECCDSSLFPIGFVDNYGLQQFLLDFRGFYNIPDPKDTLKFLYYRLQINKPYAGYVLFNYGALFGVSRYAIMKNSLDFYINLHKFLYEHKSNAYILERLWYTIF